ncbi:hypothetical protein G5B37_00560 [Rasiella rasia]|uniref:Uncharacterized protein n=1 Tax=Rasiella rasia TaxID=2744027 RepID=A0A6G6GHT6_9FLAO|nr:hypothetical protein [Rasiella rasia]QIE58109.1 hypothetical protein G5B37_00560 [Rasiella rasia]
MNTLISLVMGVVLNLLGLEVQERQQLVQLQEKAAIEHCSLECVKISEENCNTYSITSTRL